MLNYIDTTQFTIFFFLHIPKFVYTASRMQTKLGRLEAFFDLHNNGY